MCGLVALALIVVAVKWAGAMGFLRETDQIPSVTDAGWQQLLSGHRTPMGVVEKPEPFIVLGTNMDEKSAVARLERKITGEGWEIDSEPVNGGGVRFLPRGCGPGCDRFMVLRVFGGNSVHDPLLYGVEAQQLQRWQSQFRSVYLLENFHLYPAKAPWG